MGHLYARHAQSSRHAHTAHTTHSNNVRAISRRKLAHTTGASSAAHLHTTTAQPPRGMLGARGTYVYSKAHLVISRVRRAVACSLPVLVDHLFPVVVVSSSLSHSLTLLDGIKSALSPTPSLWHPSTPCPASPAHHARACKAGAGRGPSLAGS